MTSCQWLTELDPTDIHEWSDTAIALSLLSRASLPILPTFIVGKSVYTAFFHQPRVQQLIERQYKSLTVASPAEFAGTAQLLRQLVVRTELPPRVRTELKHYYQQLKTLVLHAFASNLPLQLTYGEHSLEVNAASALDVERAIKQLYSLQFTEQALHRGVQSNAPMVARPEVVTIQYWPVHEAKGVAHAHDLDQHDDTVVVITVETPKSVQYRVDAKSRLLLTAAREYVLSDQQLQELTKLTYLASQQFAEPHKINWTLSHNQFWLSRSQPLHTPISTEQPPQATLPLLKGLSGNVGIVCGPVRLVATSADRAKVKDGEIVVTQQLSPEDYRWLVGVAGLLTEHGTQTGIEAHLAKRLGIPALVGANLRQPLHNGQLITLDGTHGLVYAGRFDTGSIAPILHEGTGTKVLTTILDLAQPIPHQLGQSDGALIMRSSSLLELLQEHPHRLLQPGRQQEYQDLLTDELAALAEAVFPQPLIYQFHDPIGRWKPSLHVEPNPLMGFRGAHRLIQQPDLLELELHVLHRLLTRGLTNVVAMLPMVRHLSEVTRFQQLMAHNSLADQLRGRLWLTCATPAIAILADQLPDLGIAGVCVDLHTLSQLMTGVDADNGQMGHMLDQSDSAVLQAVSYLLATCRQHGITTIITAGETVLQPAVLEAVIQAGVSGVAVQPREVAAVRRAVANLEQRLLLTHLLNDSESTFA